MSDNLSDADKIRNKRLAKLGNQSAPSPSGDSSPSSEQPSSTQTTPKPQTQQSPSTLRQQSPTPTQNTSRINIRPASNTNAGSAAQPRAKSQQRTDSRDSKPEDWENDTLSSLFRITLDSARTTDQYGNTLYFAKSVAEELEAEGVSRTLTVPSDESSGSLDSCITDAASNQGKKKPLEYLLQCWKRITRLSRQVKAGPPDAKKTHVVNEARRLCMSYSIFAVTIPDMFESEDQSSSFLPHLLVDLDAETALDFEWLQEAVSRLGDDDELKEKLVEAVEQMSQEVAQKSMNDSYQPYVQALARLLRFNPLVAAISESPMFLGSNVQAQDLERNTLLGPFFRLSPLQSEVALNYFSAPRTRDRGFIANSQNALRMTLSQHQVSLFDIVERFLKVRSARDRLLDWFALTVNGNHRRRAMQVDYRYVSSDGFMVNVTACLDRLCEPFMDASFAKIDRIDIDYLRRSPRVNIADETKINADQAASDKFYAERLEGENNFISEVFFLCAAAHHYGTEAAQTKLKDSQKYLKRLDEQIDSFAAERSKYENGPAHILAVFDQRLQQAKNEQDKKHSTHYATEGVLLDEQLQLRAMSFMRYIVVWLMRLVTGVDFPKQKNLTLPLPEEQPEHIRCLPEYFLDDVVDHFKFVTEVMPQVITPTQCEELVMICITFLESSEYIKNPGLKSGMVVILFHGVWPTRNSNTGALGGLLNSLPFATKYLLHALMKAFIECESSGEHNQFYSKFNTRYEIFQIVKCIWSNPVYREKLGIEASENIDFFVRFTNLLLNDSTFLLDEVFSSFHKITSLEKEITSPTFTTLPEADQTQKKDLLDETKRTAKNYMPLVQETLQMMKLFTSALADSFTMPEVVQRLADMMDYNLDAMVGPKKNTLRVNDMEEYKFHPASMLSDIADVYLNLAAKPSFHTAIARDGRSYRPANFAAAEEILRAKANRSTSELLAWKKLARDIEAAKEADEAEEEDLGEIPDEFLDPLLATLMTDPVILPTSRSVVDRSTIRQMLLSEERDPFNRAPLKLADVLPDAELKGRIDAFRAEKRGRKGGSGDANVDADAMDTSQG